MDLEVFISTSSSIVAICVYVVALWIGGQQTISTLSGFANVVVALLVVVLGLAYSLGMHVSTVVNPGTWALAIANLVA